MKKSIVTAALVASFTICGLAHGAMQVVTQDYSYTGPNQLKDMAHDNYYTWGINLGAKTTNQVSISSASITFYNIYDWKVEPYDLYVELLDSAIPGTVTTGIDNSSSGNAFGTGVDRRQLVDYQYKDTTSIPMDTGTTYHNKKVYQYWDSAKSKWAYTTTLYSVTYTFTKADLDILNLYAIDGVIGLGFDPDCHFYDTGVTFNITTTETSGHDPVPEPATMLLFGTGLAGLAGVRMRRKNS